MFIFWILGVKESSESSTYVMTIHFWIRANNDYLSNENTQGRPDGEDPIVVTFKLDDNNFVGLDLIMSFGRWGVNLPYIRVLV